MKTTLTLLAITLASCASSSRYRMPYTGNEIRWCQKGPVGLTLDPDLTDTERWATVSAQHAIDLDHDRPQTYADYAHEDHLPQISVVKVPSHPAAVLGSRLIPRDNGCLAACVIQIGDGKVPASVLRAAIGREIEHCLGYKE